MLSSVDRTCLMVLQVMLSEEVNHDTELFNLLIRHMKHMKSKDNLHVDPFRI